MGEKIFDTHTHYDDKAYAGNGREFACGLLESTVAGFIAVGCSLKRIPPSLELAEAFPTVYASVGVHPCYVNDLQDSYLAQLEKYTAKPKVIAIGETGLDYHYDNFNEEVRTVQLLRFREQLELAKRTNLPVIVHSRDSTEDTMKLLREYKPQGVMHCYGGSGETARELIKMGILISFTGVLTFKNARRAVEICRDVPLEMLMLETDCPYMAPEPHRGKHCDSSMLSHVANKIAEIKGIAVETVIKTCNDNARRLFNINF